MPNQETVEPRTVTMYPSHWEQVDAYSLVMGYGSTSAALRRIVDEWRQFKGAQVPLFPQPVHPPASP
jgi:hypothetical protein